MAAHRTTRQGDEVFCTVCLCRWGVDENPPAICTPRSVTAPTLNPSKRIGPAHWEYLRKVLDDGPSDPKTTGRNR